MKAGDDRKMTFDYYLGIFILTVIMMLAMMLHVLHYKGFNKKQKTWFVLTFADVMLCSAAEFAVHCGYYTPSMAVPLTILTVIQFASAPLLGMLFIGALGVDGQSKTAIIYYAVNLITEIVAAPFGLVFYFNEDGYSRGPLFIVYEVFYFVSLFYLAVGMIVVGKKFRNRDARTIIMVLVVLVTIMGLLIAIDCRMVICP